jgi:hypothetical protein
MNPCFRAHLKHRFTARDGNFGVFAARALTDVFAICNKKAF